MSRCDSGKQIRSPDSNPDSDKPHSGFNSVTISQPLSGTDSGENHANYKFGRPSIRNICHVDSGIRATDAFSRGLIRAAHQFERFGRELDSDGSGTAFKSGASPIWIDSALGANLRVGSAKVDSGNRAGSNGTKQNQPFQKPAG